MPTGYFVYQILDFMDAFMFIFFFEKFLRLKKGNYLVYVLAATIGYVIVMIGLNVACCYKRIPGRSIYVILMFVLAVVLMEGSWKEKMFYSLLINGIGGMTGTITAKVISLMSEYAILCRCLEWGEKPIVTAVVNQIFSFIIFTIIYKLHIIFDEKLSKAEQNMSLMIIFLTCVVSAVLDQIEKYAKGNSNIVKLMILAVSAMLLLNIISYYLLYRINKLNDLNLSSQNLRQEIEAYQYSASELHQKYEEFRKIKHDMMNSYAIMHGLLQNGQCRELEEYLTIRSKQIEISGEFIYTGHAYLDSLLNIKFAEIINRKVELSYEIGQAVYKGIEELDLCSILGNLLDNALEAVIEVEADFRKIHVNIRGDENKVLIAVSNSVDSINIRERGALKTSKHDSGSHGIGSKIIGELAEKYGGAFTWRIKDNEFQANVLLFIK